MKTLFRIFALLLSFYIIETIIVFIILTVENILKNGVNNVFIKSDWRFIFGITVLRVLYFIIPQVCIYLLAQKFLKPFSLFKFSMLNGISFIIIFFSILFIWTTGFKDFASKSITYYFICSTIISPIILYQIPYFKRLMESI